MSHDALRDRARTVLGNPQLAMHWLYSSNRLLDGTSPAEAIATKRGRRMVERQLAWFAGRPVAKAGLGDTVPDKLHDLISDPLIQLVLERAGSGPEDLLRLCRHSGTTRKAA